MSLLLCVKNINLLFQNGDKKKKSVISNWTLISVLLYVGFVFVAYKSHKTELKQRNFHRTFTLKYFNASLKKKKKTFECKSFLYDIDFL